MLSLWYMPDAAEWSSMFYEATIVNIEEGQAVRDIYSIISLPFFLTLSHKLLQGKVHLRFNGDSEVYDIDATKLVKVRVIQAISLVNKCPSIRNRNATRKGQSKDRNEAFLAQMEPHNQKQVRTARHKHKFTLIQLHRPTQKASRRFTRTRTA